MKTEEMARWTKRLNEILSKSYDTTKGRLINMRQDIEQAYPALTDNYAAQLHDAVSHEIYMRRNIK